MEASMITMPYPGGQREGAVVVKEAEALLGSVIVLGTDHGIVLQLDPLLQAMAGQLEDRLSSGAAIEYEHQAGGSGISLGPWSACLR
jgi:hypothetical protein